MSLPITGIVLAGGAGTRFGGPKALASFGDDNCATLCVRKLLGARLTEIIVVTGASCAEVRDSLERNRLAAAPAVSIHNDPDWSRGVASGLTLGLSKVAPVSAAVLVLPVHYPFIDEATFNLLCQLFVQEPGAGGKVMVPLFEAKLGYPVIVGRDLFGELKAASGVDPVMEVARRLPSRAIGVAVEDPGTLFGIETRDDYMKALQMLAKEECCGTA